VANIGRSLFTDFLFPFELTSALLITAAVGAMVFSFAGRADKANRKTQRELVSLRFRGGHSRPSPLPGPGVFATADSVATPALLPDGSVAPESLSELIDSVSVEEFSTDLTEVQGLQQQADAHALNSAEPSSDATSGFPSQPTSASAEEVRHS
jgi:NADH-quinone oxidoreductase subunit J